MAAFDLDDVTKKVKAFGAQQSQIVLIYLYGSYAQDRAGAQSDLDLGLLFDESVAPRQQLGLAMHYGADLQRALDGKVKVDVRSLNAAPVEFLMQVIKPRQCLYARSEAERIRFEAKVMNNYCDFKPVLERYYGYMLSRIKEGDLSYGLEFRRRLTTLGYAAGAA